MTSRTATVFVTFLLCILAVTGVSQQRQTENTSRKSNHATDYIGDEACSSCHADHIKTYYQTSHHLTSRLADEHSVDGNFNPGSNLLKTSNPALHFEMTHTPEGYFESAVDEIEPGKTISEKERIDIVVGSGRKAQTYLYWQGDALFELPISYWVDPGEWINSPGYADGSLRFDRPIVPRCLECHGTRSQYLGSPNHYGKASLVLGITCEKCHGPGGEHLRRQNSTLPSRKNADQDIVNPAHLARERQMDVCALCHAGAATSIEPPGSFMPGEVLAKYLEVPNAGQSAPVDVHGNQVQLLTRSKCFRSSSMTCLTCHDVHAPQRDAASFSPRCLSCHKAESCGEFPKLGQKIIADCVDCHMPLQDSELLFSETNGQKIQPKVRNHRIAVYKVTANALP